jgi:hypothetical protein
MAILACLTRNLSQMGTYFLVRGSGCCNGNPCFKEFVAALDIVGYLIFLMLY